MTNHSTKGVLDTHVFFEPGDRGASLMLGQRRTPRVEGHMEPQVVVKALGEVALRVNDLQRMKRFYQDVLGLHVLGEFASAALLKISDGYGGHTQVLGLFDRSVRVGPEHTTVDHIAFTIALDDFDSGKRRLESLGLEVEVETHAWVKWRSLYFHDPEGNQVELVCYDESLGQ